MPFVQLCWLCFKHSTLLPLLAILRAFLFAFVYLPLIPILLAANIRYDPDVPVEVWLYRLLKAFKPHVVQFLVHLTHYFMVSLFMGSAVGVVTGFNISIVARLFGVSSPKGREPIPTQTTPRAGKLASKCNMGFSDLKNDPLVRNAAAKIGNEIKKEKAPTIKEEVLDYVKEEFVGKVRNRFSSAEKESRLVLDSAVTTFPSAKAVSNFKTNKGEEIDVLSRNIYEDDDGYALMGFGNQDELDWETVSERSIKNHHKRDRQLPETKSGGNTINSTLVDIIIEEEAEKEASPILPSGGFNKVTSNSQKSAESLPTLASITIQDSSTAKFDNLDNYGAVTVQSSDSTTAEKSNIAKKSTDTEKSTGP